jgi:hypothetical protein
MTARTIQGSPCARGHAGLRYLKSNGRPGNCVECLSVVAKAWCDENRLRRNAGRRAWRAANRDALNAKLRAWHAANPHASRAWNDANPDKRKAISRTWRVAHPEQRAATKARYRARQLEAACSCCAPWSFKFIYAQARALGMHVDHVKPLAKGGSHCLRNMVLLAPLDNLRKGAKYPADTARTQ